MFRTSVYCFCFFLFFACLFNVRVIEAKIFSRNFLKGNDNYLELAGVSSYQEFELWGVDCIAITLRTDDCFIFIYVLICIQ